MFFCFIIAMGLLARFQADFTLFLNTWLAQVGGIVATLVVTRLLRPAGIRLTVHRIVRQNWADLARIADPRRPLDTHAWTVRSGNRLDQIAARIAFVDPGDALRAIDGLSDFRLGRYIIQVRQGLANCDAQTRDAIEAALGEVSNLYRSRAAAHHPIPATATLMHMLGRAISAAARNATGRDDATLLALIGMRCNLFPHVRLIEGATR